MIFGLLCQNSVYFATVLAEKMDSLAERLEDKFEGLRIDLNRHNENLLIAINNLAGSFQRNYGKRQ